LLTSGWAAIGQAILFRLLGIDPTSKEVAGNKNCWIVIKAAAMTSKVF
jgi:hypothetical protein